MRERQCHGCTKQVEWGCFATRIPASDDGEEQWLRPAHLPITFMGEETWACPRQHIRQNPIFWAKILKFYGMYKKGHLPDRGAVVDQSNRAIEIFNILDDANEDCDREEEAQEKAKRNRETRQPPAR